MVSTLQEGQLILQEDGMVELPAQAMKVGIQFMMKYQKNLCSKKDIVFHAGLWNSCTRLLIEDGPEKKSEISFVVKSSPTGDLNAITTPYLMDRYNIEYIDILKMDIEGSEYKVFDDSVNE